MSGARSAGRFAADARAALGDDRLRSALRQATGLFAERRLGAVAAVPDWEAMRERAREIKDETLRSLDVCLESFTAAAERAGATVHWARDGAEACALVAGIAERVGASRAVKSKSMVSEEIHLNAALSDRGVEAVETDLGEFIIQLAGETPSHIIAPAIHKTRGQVAELFEARLGMEPSDDVAALTSAARGALRRHFSAAQLGISGVNFGVVETGTIVIVENEGNARLSTSVPRVHVALMGIEKLVPRFADLELFLRLLPRSGTGQQLTTYQSLLTGVKRASADEGPEELHIVLLDNGRSRMLSRPVTRQTLACIRCGACLNACPVYQQVGGHAYGSVYPGPIGAVISPQLFGLDAHAALPFASTLCGACREVCPVKIDIPAVLLHLRARVVEEKPVGAPAARGEAAAFRAYAALMSRPWLLTALARVGRWWTGSDGAEGSALPRQSWLARRGPLAAWSAGRDLRAPPRESFREAWGRRLSRGGTRR